MHVRICITFVGLLALPAAATPTFAPVLQDHMVIQRGEPVTLWGTAPEGETVTVEWKGCRASTRTTGGQWQLTLPAQSTDARGSNICASDSSGSSTLIDVLVGDVWLASGQSNMEWRIRQSEPVPASIRTNNPQVRMLNGAAQLHMPAENCNDSLLRNAAQGKDYRWNWRLCTDRSIRDFSAVATYFALRVQETQGIPIGIICNAVGGSPMESWIPRTLIEGDSRYAGMRGDQWLNSPELEAWVRGRARKDLTPRLAHGGNPQLHPYAPGYLYRNAIEPLSKLAIRGVIWYQGEANADCPDIERNTTKMVDLITAWRTTFRNRELPFLMVQLPRINTPTRPFWSEFREAQAEAARRLPGVGLICTIDLGTTTRNVHPCIKAPVGHRLADLARAQVYGEKGLPTSPRVTGWKAENTTLTISFDQALKTTDGQPPRGFVVSLSGNASDFTPLPAHVQGSKVILTLPHPWQEGMTWRYIHQTFAEPNLVGENNLPAFPFRT